MAGRAAQEFLDLVSQDVELAPNIFGLVAGRAGNARVGVDANYDALNKLLHVGPCVARSDFSSAEKQPIKLLMGKAGLETWG
jgi:hypothetical protein